jgi:hypothetical protein
MLKEFLTTVPRLLSGKKKALSTCGALLIEHRCVERMNVNPYFIPCPDIK